MNARYERIINEKRRVSERHAAMPLYERAAQFAPFAALVGYEDAVYEKARVTEKKAELDGDEIEILNYKLSELCAIGYGSEIAVSYFEKDKKKSGGAYITLKTRFLGVDSYEGFLLADGGIRIKLEDIKSIEEL